MAKRVKADILESGVPTLGSDPRSVKFHRVPVDTELPQEATCIDIKAAYPSTLARMGLVRPETLDAAMGLPKPDRLKCVGMLATRKNIQTWSDGALESVVQEDSPTRGYFFDVCRVVGQAMETLADHLDEAFAYYWVDGIFIRPDKARERYAVEYLSDMGYRVTVEKVTNVRRSAGGKFILYRKGGKASYLCVPQQVEVDDPELYRMIAEANG